LIGHSGIALSAEQLPDVSRVICINAGGGVYLKEAFEQFRYSGQQLLISPSLAASCLIDLLFTRANVARSLAVGVVNGDCRCTAGSCFRTLLNSTTEAEINHLPQLVSQLRQQLFSCQG